MTKRMKQLMEAASKSLRDGNPPFTTEWLVEHNVTSKECMDLSVMIADAVDLMTIFSEVPNTLEFRNGC